MNGYVFINAYGLVRFKSTSESKFEDCEKQYKGKVKLPYGVYGIGMKKWIDYDHYFDASQIYATPELAIKTITNERKNV